MAASPDSLYDRHQVRRVICVPTRSKARLADRRGPLGQGRLVQRVGDPHGDGRRAVELLFVAVELRLVADLDLLRRRCR